MARACYVQVEGVHRVCDAAANLSQQQAHPTEHTFLCRVCPVVLSSSPCPDVVFM